MSDYNTSIHKYIKAVRIQLSNNELISGILTISGYMFSTFYVILIVESIFYLEIFYRQKVMIFFWLFSITGYSYYILQFLINRNQWFGNRNDELIARYIGKRSSVISDQILNTLQIENNKLYGSDDKSLIQHAIERMQKKLDSIPSESIKNNVSDKLIKTVIIIITLFFISFGSKSSSLYPASIRLFSPNTEFPVPLPFSLVSMTGDLNVIGGDSIIVSIAGVGDIPDSVTLNWESNNINKQKMIFGNNEIYSYTFSNISTDLIYWAEVNNKSWFSPWNKISSTKNTIFVTDRPVIEDIRFNVVPPKYSKENPFDHPGNITDVYALRGSQVNINATASKLLSKSWILMNGNRSNLSIRDNRISGNFSLTENMEVSFWCIDKNLVSNNHPPQFRFSVIPDNAPEIIVISPEREFDLDEKMEVDFNIQINDDFGFSKANIEYNIIHPDYLQEDTSTYFYNLPGVSKNVKSQQLNTTWDIGSLNLGPEDEIHFYILISDNNTLSGPTITKSQKFIGKYPSLEDLFMDYESKEDEVQVEAKEIQMSLEDVLELVEELELELLKSDEVNWEQSQKVEESLDKMQDIQEQIETMQEQMELMSELAENNQLISPELQEKYSQLQEMLSEIMTPELMEAMEKLQDAMENMDSEQLMQALQEFEFNAEEFEEQMDRFMEMFQQAIAEQKLDEVVKRLEEMVEEQVEIMDSMDDIEPNTNDLASRERRQEESFEYLKEAMEDAAESMEKFAQQPAQEMKDLLDSELTSETSQELEDTRKALQQKDMQNAMGSGSQSQGNLEQMLNQATSIQNSYQQQTINEMMSLFQRVVQSILAVSQNQEKLIIESKMLKSRSPRLIKMAVKQGEVRVQTNQTIEQLVELSKKSFYISSAINRAMGRARTGMDKTISQLEQRNITKGKSSQITAIKGLNEAANLMLVAMDQMQSSGSASGFESFMEALSQMSGQQQGINQSTMQLGGMNMMNQQGLMQRLQAQQQQLQQALNELLSENPGEDSGGLGKAEQDMEEVIQDFKRRKIDRQTMEKQERILSRMLDAQKSLSQRDYSEKRKSIGGATFTFDGPAGLPADLGEREILLIEAMEEALQEGHSREYQAIIKTYFRELQKLESQDSE